MRLRLYSFEGKKTNLFPMRKRSNSYDCLFNCTVYKNLQIRIYQEMIDRKRGGKGSKEGWERECTNFLSDGIAAC